MRGLKKWPVELMCWTGALVALFFASPKDQHFAICPLHHAGFDWCPGCGVGRSIHYAMRGDWEASWSHHYLGFFALIIILIRIVSLIHQYYKAKLIKELYE